MQRPVTNIVLDIGITDWGNREPKKNEKGNVYLWFKAVLE